MDPVAALREIAYYKDRAREEPRRVMAYRRAADVVEALDDAERDRLGQTNGWQRLSGVGPEDRGGDRAGLVRRRSGYSRRNTCGGNGLGWR